jgi:hypothetical protein
VLRPLLLALVLEIFQQESAPLLHKQLNPSQDSNGTTAIVITTDIVVTLAYLAAVLFFLCQWNTVDAADAWGVVAFASMLVASYALYCCCSKPQIDYYLLCMDTALVKEHKETNPIQTLGHTLDTKLDTKLDALDGKLNTLSEHVGTLNQALYDEESGQSLLQLLNERFERQFPEQVPQQQGMGQ